MIKRQIESVLKDFLFQGRALIISGARQVGKSTLVNQLVESLNLPYAIHNCEDEDTKVLFADSSISNLQRIVGENKVIVVDEAQQIPDIGMTLKRIIDKYREVQVIITGSSSLDLMDRLQEPLTGRKFEFHLYPFSTKEIYDAQGILAVKQTLPHRLIFGSYPYVMNNPMRAQEAVVELANSYLYKDILKVDGIRRSVLLDKLVKALAFQVCNLISYNEIAQLIGTDNKTVERYIDLLEKCFIVFRLPGLSRNGRNELKKSKKIYFYDNGIRNAVINNFAPLELRNDVGELWENFIVGERIKHNEYNGIHTFNYFWRTKEQQEIDWVEERDGRFFPAEFKWNERKANVKLPNNFANNYDHDPFLVVTPSNYLDWLKI